MLPTMDRLLLVDGEFDDGGRCEGLSGPMDWGPEGRRGGNSVLGSYLSGYDGVSVDFDLNPGCRSPDDS